jgi:hypothetical protein
MSEREIRTIIQRVREELDRQAKRLIYPTLIGAGLALTGCDDNVAAYGVPMYAAPLDGRIDHKVSGPDMAYGVPDRMRTEAVVPKPDMAYGVPDLKKLDTAVKKDTTKLDAGGVILYAVPSDASIKKDTAVVKDDGVKKLDAGGVILYSVVMPDAK